MRMCEERPQPVCSDSVYSGTERILFPGKRVLGLTGGVGAGKSEVLKRLEKVYGAGILEADRVCNEIILSDGPAYAPMISLLGEGIVAEDGELDKKRIAALIFGDPEKKKQVNALLHPATFDEVVRRIKASDKTLIVYESALPDGARFGELCESLLYVYAAEETRCRRLMENRGYSREKAESIIRQQWSDAQFRAAADAVITNNGSLRSMYRSVKAAMTKLGF